MCHAAEELPVPIVHSDSVSHERIDGRRIGHEESGNSSVADQEWADKMWRSYSGELARRVMTVRKARGMTQQELADEIGCNRNAVSRVERNDTGGKIPTPADPRLSLIYRLAKALHVPPAALLPAPGEYIHDYLQIRQDEFLGYEIMWPEEPGELILFKSMTRRGKRKRSRKGTAR